MIESPVATSAVSSTPSYRTLLAQILPRAGEVRWQEIPWQTDLWQARKLALQQGKPIFAWMMNGSPLGCT